MTSPHFNIETTGLVGSGAIGRHIARIAARDRLANTFAKLAAKGKPHATDINEPNEARS